MKMILKGVLLWSTLISVLLLLSGIDSLGENGVLVQAVIFCTLLIFLSYKLISREEFEILSLSRFINRILK